MAGLLEISRTLKSDPQKNKTNNRSQLQERSPAEKDFVCENNDDFQLNDFSSKIRENNSLTVTSFMHEKEENKQVSDSIEAPVFSQIFRPLKLDDAIQSCNMQEVQIEGEIETSPRREDGRQQVSKKKKRLGQNIKDRQHKKKQTEASQENAICPKPKTLKFESNSPRKSQIQRQRRA